MSGSVSPLPWTGNKGCIYTTIDAFMPPHRTYVEACMGSAEVFLRKKPVEKEIINDYNGDLVRLFRVLQRNENLERLIGRLFLSFNSEQIFRANKALLAEVPNILDDLTETSVIIENTQWNDFDLAVAFYENQVFSFSSTGKNFAITKKDMTKRFGRLIAACARLRNATIMHRDYKDCISYGISGRARLFEVVQRVEEINRYRRSKAPGRKLDGESYDDPELKRNPSLALSYIVAPPRMSYYMETSARIYDVYLKFIAPEDIHVYSIDEVFIDLTPYLKTYQKTPREMAEMLIKEVLTTTGITATAGIGTNMYLAKVAMDITAKKMPADENGVRIAELDEMSYRRELWTHRPLTDFWMVGRGISKKLEDNYMFTMGDVARCSQYNEAKVGTEITEGENELWL